MEIRHPQRSPYPAVIPAEQALPVSPAQRSLHVPSSWASGEIIDCVEISSGRVPSTLDRQTAYPIRADRPPSAKGQFIDIWI